MTAHRKPPSRRARTATKGDVGYLQAVPDAGAQVGERELTADELRPLLRGSPIADAWLAEDHALAEDLLALRRRRQGLERVLADEPLVTGSKGQPVMNPLAGEVDRLARRGAQLARVLGIGALHRLHLGAEVASVSMRWAELNRRVSTSYGYDDGEAEDAPHAPTVDVGDGGPGP